MTANTISSTTDSRLGGSFTLPGSDIALRRLGYGAMQLAGKGVWGPPRDPDAAVAVLREAVPAGINHLDTADFYGPHITNQLIRQALHPYPEELTIVTKVNRATNLPARCATISATCEWTSWTW